MTKHEKRLREHIKKHVTPGAYNVLQEHNLLKQQNEEMLFELETITTGIAFSKETGIIWSHRLDHIKNLVERINTQNKPI